MIPKFRVWNSETKEIEVFKTYEEISELFLALSTDDGFYSIMQSTCLFDKNGKEIFEGDIIQTSAFACIVGFGQYTYVGDRNALETEIGFYLSFLNIKPATYAPFDKYYWDNCEVIGNIHENELDLIMYEVSKFNKEIEDET